MKAKRGPAIARSTGAPFLRAESFYNFATYIDQVSNLRAYGGKPLPRDA